MFFDAFSSNRAVRYPARTLDPSTRPLFMWLSGAVDVDDLIVG